MPARLPAGAAACQPADTAAACWRTRGNRAACQALIVLPAPSLLCPQGNRTPHTDALSRGAVTGLALSHGRGHVFRALLESICFGTEHIFETMRGNGYAPTSVAVAGGATRSELWMQIHADVSNVPFILTKVWG